MFSAIFSSPISGRHLELGELLDGYRVRHVVRERGKVVQPVRVGHELVVGHVLRNLLVADLGEAPRAWRASRRLSRTPCCSRAGQGSPAGPCRARTGCRSCSPQSSRRRSRGGTSSLASFSTAIAYAMLFASGAR